MAEDREERLSAVRGFPSKTSHRLSALSGLAGVVLIVSAYLLDIERPMFDDPPAEYAAYYEDKQSQVQIAMLLFMFSTFAFAWYLGFLRWLYEGAERAARGFVRAAPIAFAGGIAGLAAIVAGGIAQLTAVEVVGSVPPSVVRALDLMGIYGQVWGEVLLSVFLLSSFFIVRVTEVLPSWLGVTAMIGTVLGFFQAVLVLAPQEQNGVFGYAGLVWFLVFAIYIVGSSLNLAKRTETALLAG